MSNKPHGMLAKVKDLLLRFDALNVLLANELPGAAIRKWQHVDAMTRQELVRLHKWLEKRIHTLRKRYEARVPDEELVRLAQQIGESVGNSRPATFRKADLKLLFGRYDLVLPRFADLPEHARIDIGRPIATRDGQVNIFIIEAILYEDMCALYNMARQQDADVEARWRKRELDRQPWKYLHALSRGAISTAFYFVEAYLNGLAFNHLVAHGHRADEKTKTTLAEWDEPKQKRCVISFGRKLQEYPQLVMGRDDPSLTPDRCPEIKFLLETHKKVRDAIAHASPVPDPKKGETLWSAKEVLVFNPDIRTVEEIVDNAVNVVRIIETAVHGHTRRLHWLRDRDASGSGLFPKGAFQ